MGRMDELRENIEKKVVGKGDVIENMIIALIAGGHVLLEDVPGVGKTSMARALAQSLDCSFARIQFTPDTLPSDIVGGSVYNMQEGTFHTVLGPICHQIVLADEINRASPKTQAALLEAMEERQVTIDGVSTPIPEPFMVIATDNPMESVGTYPLPDSQLDRFMMKLSVGYPSREASREMAKRFLSGAMEEETKCVMSARDVLAVRGEAAQVGVDDSLVDYLETIVEATRDRSEVACGASPRSSLELIRACRARAYVRGRNYCIPEDIITMSQVVLPHRLILTGQAQMGMTRQSQVVRDVIGKIPIPV